MKYLNPIFFYFNSRPATDRYSVITGGYCGNRVHSRDDYRGIPELRHDNLFIHVTQEETAFLQDFQRNSWIGLCNPWCSNPENKKQKKHRTPVQLQKKANQNPTHSSMTKLIPNNKNDVKFM